MLPRFEYGEAVRVTRNIHNDGTYPGLERGALLIRRGSVGHVRNRGTFLQDQVIYEVHFLDNDRLVGCREEELIGESDPWVPTRFEFGDKVCTRVALAVGGEVTVPIGSQGEILKVLRDADGGPQYHVRFPGRTFQVPETALESTSEEAEHGE